MEDSKVIRLSDRMNLGDSVEVSNEDTTAENTNDNTPANESVNTEPDASEKDSETKAFKFLDLNQQIQDMKDVKNNIIEQELKVFNDDSIQVALDKAIKNMTVEEIKAASKDQIEKIYTIDEKSIELDLEISDEQRAFEFKRDFLVYKKESAVALLEIDEALAKMEEDVKKEEEEFNKVINQYGNLSNFIRQKLVEDSTNAPTEEYRAVYKKMLDYFDGAFNLDMLVEKYSTLKTINTIKDYEDSTRSQSIYGKYVQATKKLGLKSDLTSFPDLEVKFLPEKYHKYPNLFLFAIIKLFGYKKDTVEKNTDGIFLSQFGVNLKNLYADRFDTPEIKQEFIQNIEKVLDLFYK
jgi:hypothetical protein